MEGGRQAASREEVLPGHMAQVSITALYSALSPVARPFFYGELFSASAWWLLTGYGKEARSEQPELAAELRCLRYWISLRNGTCRETAGIFGCSSRGQFDPVLQEPLVGL